MCFTSRVMRRRSWTTIIAGLAVLPLAACADDAVQTAPTTTLEPAPSTTTITSTSSVPTTSTTTPATTTTAVTTSTVAPTSTVPGSFPYWSVACTERSGDPTARYEFDEALGTFSTLGPAPSLDLVMPEVVTSAGPYGSIASTSPIPGGVLVGVYPPDGWPSADEMLTSSSLVAVDHDGGLRWRRCFDDLHTGGFVVAPAELEPTIAWVVGAAWTEPLQITGVDLATGADVAFPIDVAELGERGRGERFLVLGVPIGTRPLAADDRLTVVDTLDGAHFDVPVPPSWVGNEGGWVQVVDANPFDDDVVLADGWPSPGEVAAVFVDGAWSDDPADQRAVLPAQVTETFGDPYELRLFDGAGDLVWAVPEFHSVSREGFHWAVADTVVVAMRCPEWDADGSCGWTGDVPPTEELVAFDLGTGEELWTSSDDRSLPVLAGDLGIALLVTGGPGAADDGYVLVDLRTGERVGPPGDPWPSGAFLQECCGGDVYTNVRRAGGVVIATDQGHVRVWYPPELTAPTVSVDLAG